MTDDEREARIRSSIAGRTMYEGREEHNPDEFLLRRLDEARAEIKRLKAEIAAAEARGWQKVRQAFSIDL